MRRVVLAMMFALVGCGKPSLPAAETPLAPTVREWLDLSTQAIREKNLDLLVRLYGRESILWGAEELRQHLRSDQEAAAAFQKDYGMDGRSASTDELARAIIKRELDSTRQVRWLRFKEYRTTAQVLVDIQADRPMGRVNWTLSRSPAGWRRDRRIEVAQSRIDHLVRSLRYHWSGAGKDPKPGPEDFVLVLAEFLTPKEAASKKGILDPWGNPYEYVEGVRFRSRGPNGTVDDDGGDDLAGYPDLMEDPSAEVNLEAAAIETRKCAENLKTLAKLLSFYREKHGGQEKRFPTHTGGSFWTQLAMVHPPLIDPSMSDLLFCPGAQRTSYPETSYQGPNGNANRFSDTDPIGACVGRHADGSINVLLKNGEVKTITGADDLLRDAVAHKTIR